MRNTRLISALALGAALSTFVASPAVAQESDSNILRATPFAFVGTADQCGGAAGSRIVTAAWLGGMGLPDNGGQNTTAVDLLNNVNDNRNDPHLGLLLSKNGPTPDCSSAGATISGMGRNFTVTQLGFDYRNGGHCGAGAPRFNITGVDGTTYFAGCAAGAPTPAPQDLTEWTRVLINNPAQVFPPTFVFGVTQVRSIAIVYDEGTDTPSLQDPLGVGLAVLDNINVNGRFIRRGTGIADGINDRDDDRDDDRR